jgi:streptogramin lyase
MAFQRALNVLAAATATVLLSLAASAGQIETIAGTGKDADGGEAGVGTTTNVGNPFGVEIGPDGALYICEVTNHRVRRLDLATGRMTTVAGCGQKGYAGDGGPATKAHLNEPYEVRFDPQGNMYFVEMQNHVVRKVDARWKTISTLAGTGKPGFSGDNGPAERAQLQQPHSIALDGAGAIYIADIGNHRIRRVDPATGFIRTIAGNGAKQVPQDGQKAEGAPIFGPRALAIVGDTMWIALREGNSVWRMDMKRGFLFRVSGTGRKDYSGHGPALGAAWNGPKGIAIGPDGQVYVVDTENQAIRRIDVKQGSVQTIAGNGPKGRGYNGDGKDATLAELNRPHGICVGPDGTVYIGDSENHRVRRFKP